MIAKEDRPPYVMYELVAEEDREATIASGVYSTKDVVYAMVTPQGSKDRIPRRADEWFQNLEQQVREGRFPLAWLDAFRGQFKLWKEGVAPPINGTAVELWPAVSPAQIKALQNAMVRTVEDLAVANEEAIARLGMGGRALKQRAIDWLTAAEGPGKVAEQMSALRAENASLKAINENFAEKLKKFEAQLAVLTKSE